MFWLLNWKVRKCFRRSITYFGRKNWQILYQAFNIVQISCCKSPNSTSNYIKHGSTSFKRLHLMRWPSLPWKLVSKGEINLKSRLGFWINHSREKIKPKVMDPGPFWPFLINAFFWQFLCNGIWSRPARFYFGKREIRDLPTFGLLFYFNSPNSKDQNLCLFCFWPNLY